jgi:leader peptidase (prepilin peptidase) / N-methyltransferase
VPLAVCLALSVPAAWIVGALRERVPDRLALLRPLPGYHLDRGQLMVQVVTTALFALVAVRFDTATVLALAGYLVFFTAMVALAAIDLDTKRLPDLIVGGALVLSIPLVTVASVAGAAPAQIRYALLGGAFYFGFLLLTHLAFPAGMGFGDVKLSALLGLYVGWLATSGLSAVVLVLDAMVAGFVAGSAVGVVLFAFNGRRSRHYPFGPFLIGGAVLVIAFSPQLLPAGA